jgi:hypothetical protein
MQGAKPKLKRRNPRRYKPMLDVLDSEEQKVKRDTGSMIDGFESNTKACLLGVR